MTTDPLTPTTYAGAGVDIEAGNRLVRAIAEDARSTAVPGVMGAIGGFGGLFDLKATGLSDPILVAGTDGVGTKVKLAAACGLYDGIGSDLVAMCANDVLVQGAMPLFFLDYYATGKLDVAVGEKVVKGIAAACREAECALLGGETAEMPGVYAEGDFDLAGFCVGAVERDRLLPRADLQPGDLVLGLTASGAHANGFSLIRRIVEESGLRLDEPCPFEDGTLGEALLRPTRIYVRALKPALTTGRIKALAHITGGGLVENVPRVLPEGLAAILDGGSWPVPPLFGWLAATGRVPQEEMLRTFNCGIGMVAICAPADEAGLRRIIAHAGVEARIIGRLASRGEGPGCVVDAPDKLF